MAEKTNRIIWADLLRLIAIFMVISIHCSDPFNVSPEARSNPEYNLWGSIYGAFLRPCVPLFVMLTGMLLLPVKQEIGQFYHKRMLRVIVPFIIWSLLYNLFPWVTGLLGLDSSVLTTMFPYAGDNPSQTFESSLHNILMIPFNFNTYTVPLWYIYMLIGLYLYMPFFSAWIKQATKKTDEDFLVHLGCHFVPSILPGVYLELHRGNLRMERFRHIVLLFRLQRIFTVGILPERQNKPLYKIHNSIVHRPSCLGVRSHLLWIPSDDFA